jgi:hypothetical protein
MKTTALGSALGFLVYGLVVFALFFGARRPAMSAPLALPAVRSVAK